MLETTALGAAMAAGKAKGIEVWDGFESHAVPVDIFFPSLKEDGKRFSSFAFKGAASHSPPPPFFAILHRK